MRNSSLYEKNQQGDIKSPFGPQGINEAPKTERRSNHDRTAPPHRWTECETLSADGGYGESALIWSRIVETTAAQKGRGGQSGQVIRLSIIDCRVDPRRDIPRSLAVPKCFFVTDA
jgi:hypothetical protein